MEVGERDFRGGGEKDGSVFQTIHIFLELGELAGALHALTAHEARGPDFGIAVPGGVEVEHEGDERPLEACAGSRVTGEAGAADFCGALEVYEVKALGDGDMVFALGSPDVSPAADFLIIVGGGAVGGVIVGEIGDAEEQILLVLPGGGDFLLEGLHLRGKEFRVCLECGGILATGAELADLLAEAFAFGLGLLPLGFGGAAAGVALQHGVYERGELRVAQGKPGFDRVGIFPQKANIEHGGEEFRKERVAQARRRRGGCVEWLSLMGMAEQVGLG